MECLGVNNTPEPTPPHANPFAVDTEETKAKEKHREILSQCQFEKLFDRFAAIGIMVVPFCCLQQNGYKTYTDMKICV